MGLDRPVIKIPGDTQRRFQSQGRTLVVPGLPLYCPPVTQGAGLAPPVPARAAA
jgi:hypothetical protein